MNDLKPFKHGEEGTHAVCNKHDMGGKSVCCECAGKTDCSTNPPSESLEKILKEFREKCGESHVIESFLSQAYQSGVEDTIEKVEKAKDSRWKIWKRQFRQWI